MNYLFFQVSHATINPKLLGTNYKNIGKYRVVHHLLGLTDQFNMIYYNNNQNFPNVNTLIDTHICPIYLYDWTLNDHTSYHNKT